MATSKLVNKSDINLIAKDYATRLKAKVDAQDEHGLYPNVDKTKVAGIEIGAQVNKIESIELNGEAFTVEGKKATGTIDAVTSTTLSTTLQDYTPTDQLEDAMAGQGFAKTEDIPTDIVKESELAEKVKGVVGSVYRPKGSKNNKAEIEAIEDAVEGDVWNALDNGANYAYTADGTWDKLSETVDLSGYTPTTDLEQNYAKKSELPNVDGMLTENDVATSEEILAEIAAGVAAAQSA